MSVVTHKTEIEPLNGTPEKRMFWSIISDYDIQTGLTELIDNAIDNWIAVKNRGDLNIEVMMDTDRQMVIIEDNAGGVKHENLRLLIAPGGSLNSPDGESIGIFGVGSKRAVIALAENVAIKTHHPEDASFQIDITKEWLESPDWELAAYTIPEVLAGSTRVELSQLRKSLNRHDEEALRKHIAETYEWFLAIDNCNISVNGITIEPKSFDNWAYPEEFVPRHASFTISPDRVQKLSVEITAGLILDRDPVRENYGAYFYCNNRLIVKELKTREVGYYVGSEAGVPHPDASLCRVIVKLNGPAKLMPWNSSKTGINFSHTAFVQLRPTLIQLVSHFSSLSRRLKNDWSTKVFPHDTGEIQKIDPSEVAPGKKLILPELPRVQKAKTDHLKAKNKVTLEQKPWTLGLLEAVAAVDIISRQRLVTGNRIALVLLDSNFEIALKEFIVHSPELYDPTVYNDVKIAEIFKSRHKVIQTVIEKKPQQAGMLERARHYYNLRNKLIHERATVGVTSVDIDNYRNVIEEILRDLFGLQF